jgi:hypothetical protein
MFKEEDLLLFMDKALEVFAASSVRARGNATPRLGVRLRNMQGRATYI